VTDKQITQILTNMMGWGDWKGFHPLRSDEDCMIAWRKFVERVEKSSISTKKEELMSKIPIIFSNQNPNVFRRAICECMVEFITAEAWKPPASSDNYVMGVDLAENTPTIPEKVKLMQEKTKAQGVQFTTIPDYTDLMTIQDWIDCCDDGCLTDDDGCGELATNKEVSNVVIAPSDRKTMKIPDWATHVAWYNK